MYRQFESRTVNNWMDEPKRPEGMNRRGKEYFLEVKQLDKEFARNNILLFFFVTRYGMGDLRTMMRSGKRQRELIYSLMKDLKKYAVTEEWDKVFRREINNLDKRCKHVFFILKDNIRLTELYPYFQETGFDRLVDFGVRYANADDSAADQLEKEIAEWRAGHEKEIAEHMASVAGEIAARDEHRRRVAEQDKAEKEARRLARKAANAEVREIRENNRRYAMRKRKIERSFERYYK